ncbi:hypothetical protein PG987_013466 [Apiospora arundinis]
MPFPRVPSFGKKWADPELSCGSQIMTTRLGRSRSAWWAHGPALERFEQDIEPRIGEALMNVELGYADIYYRLYMIGKRAEISKPVIMICCTDSQIRNNVERSIRSSGVMDGHPEFGLGACALPLEQPTPARPLGVKTGVMTTTTTTTVDGGMFGLRETPITTGPTDTEDPGAPLGLRITALDGAGRYQTTTGGVVIKVRSTYYQMTVKSASSERVMPELEPNYSISSDLEECHFDGQSDEDEDEDGDGDAEVWDTTTRGSLTPVDSMTKATTWADLANVDSHSTSTKSSNITHPWLQLTTPTYPLIRHQSELRRSREDLGKTRFVPPPGLEAMLGGGGSRIGLNYVLLPVVGQLKGANEIQLRHHRFQPTLSIQDVADIPSRPLRIVAVTGSSGVVNGWILPGATYVRAANTSTTQKLYAVQLDGAVHEGDCGSVVIDQESGALYGHIVRGCPYTGTAYIVSAGEVFLDIKERFGVGAVTIAPGNRMNSVGKLDIS